MDTGVILRFLLLLGVAILLFLPTVWAIRDVAYGNFHTMKTKVIWFVVVTLLPPIGALIYILIGRPRVRIEAGLPEDQDEDVEEEKDEAGG
jgi:hypothetical protein